MIARTAAGSWQTILADLSLILFMVTASALANAPDAPLGPDEPVPAKAAPRAPQPASAPAPLPSAPPPPLPSLRAEPVGLWRDAPGAPPLAEWLAQEGRDPRLRVTIAVRYSDAGGSGAGGSGAGGPGGGGRAGALATAARLAAQAGPRAATARIVVEPGAMAGASVALGYDDELAAGTGLAASGA